MGNSVENFLSVFGWNLLLSVCGRNLVSGEWLLLGILVSCDCWWFLEAKWVFPCRRWRRCPELVLAARSSSLTEVLAITGQPRCSAYISALHEPAISPLRRNWTLTPVVVTAVWHFFADRSLPLYELTSQLGVVCCAPDFTPYHHCRFILSLASFIGNLLLYIRYANFCITLTSEKY